MHRLRIQSKKKMTFSHYFRPLNFEKKKKFKNFNSLFFIEPYNFISTPTTFFDHITDIPGGDIGDRRYSQPAMTRNIKATLPILNRLPLQRILSYFMASSQTCRYQLHSRESLKSLKSFQILLGTYRTSPTHQKGSPGGRSPSSILKKRSCIRHSEDIPLSRTEMIRRVPSHKKISTKESFFQYLFNFLASSRPDSGFKISSFYPSFSVTKTSPPPVPAEVCEAIKSSASSTKFKDFPPDRHKPFPGNTYKIYRHSPTPLPEVCKQEKKGVKAFPQRGPLGKAFPFRGNLIKTSPESLPGCLSRKEPAVFPEVCKQEKRGRGMSENLIRLPQGQQEGNVALPIGKKELKKSILKEYAISRTFSFFNSGERTTGGRFFSYFGLNFEDISSVVPAEVCEAIKFNKFGLDSQTVPLTLKSGDNLLPDHKSSIFVRQDNFFINYKKPFLCYWLLPFLGFISVLPIFTRQHISTVSFFLSRGSVGSVHPGSRKISFQKRMNTSWDVFVPNSTSEHPLEIRLTGSPYLKIVNFSLAIFNRNIKYNSQFYWYWHCFFLRDHLSGYNFNLVQEGKTLPLGGPPGNVYGFVPKHIPGNDIPGKKYCKFLIEHPKREDSKIVNLPDLKVFFPNKIFLNCLLSSSYSYPGNVCEDIKNLPGMYLGGRDWKHSLDKRHPFDFIYKKKREDIGMGGVREHTLKDSFPVISNTSFFVETSPNRRVGEVFMGIGRYQRGEVSPGCLSGEAFEAFEAFPQKGEHFQGMSSPLHPQRRQSKRLCDFFRSPSISFRTSGRVLSQEASGYISLSQSMQNITLTPYKSIKKALLLMDGVFGYPSHTVGVCEANDFADLYGSGHRNDGLGVGKTVSHDPSYSLPVKGKALKAFPGNVSDVSPGKPDQKKVQQNVALFSEPAGSYRARWLRTQDKRLVRLPYQRGGKPLEKTLGFIFKNRTFEHPIGIRADKSYQYFPGCLSGGRASSLQPFRGKVFAETPFFLLPFSSNISVLKAGKKGWGGTHSRGSVGCLSFFVPTVQNTSPENLPGCLSRTAGSSGKAFKDFPQRGLLGKAFPEVCQQEKRGVEGVKHFPSLPFRGELEKRGCVQSFLETSNTSPLWYRKACPIPIKTYKISPASPSTLIRFGDIPGYVFVEKGSRKREKRTSDFGTCIKNNLRLSYGQEELYNLIFKGLKENLDQSLRYHYERLSRVYLPRDIPVENKRFPLPPGMSDSAPHPGEVFMLRRIPPNTLREACPGGTDRFLPGQASRKECLQEYSIGSLPENTEGSRKRGEGKCLKFPNLIYKIRKATPCRKYRAGQSKFVRIIRGKAISPYFYRHYPGFYAIEYNVKSGLKPLYPSESVWGEILQTFPEGKCLKSKYKKIFKLNHTIRGGNLLLYVDPSSTLKVSGSRSNPYFTAYSFPSNIPPDRHKHLKPFPGNTSPLWYRKACPIPINISLGCEAGKKLNLIEENKDLSTVMFPMCLEAHGSQTSAGTKWAVCKEEKIVSTLSSSEAAPFFFSIKDVPNTPFFSVPYGKQEEETSNTSPAGKATLSFEIRDHTKDSLLPDHKSANRNCIFGSVQGHLNQIEQSPFGIRGSQTFPLKEKASKPSPKGEVLPGCLSGGKIFSNYINLITNNIKKKFARTGITPYKLRLTYLPEINIDDYTYGKTSLRPVSKTLPEIPVVPVSVSCLRRPPLEVFEAFRVTLPKASKTSPSLPLEYMGRHPTRVFIPSEKEAEKRGGRSHNICLEGEVFDVKGKCLKFIRFPSSYRLSEKIFLSYLSKAKKCNSGGKSTRNKIVPGIFLDNNGESLFILRHPPGGRFHKSQTLPFFFCSLRSSLDAGGEDISGKCLKSAGSLIHSRDRHQTLGDIPLREWHPTLKAIPGDVSASCLKTSPLFRRFPLKGKASKTYPLGKDIPRKCLGGGAWEHYKHSQDINLIKRGSLNTKLGERMFFLSIPSTTHNVMGRHPFPTHYIHSRGEISPRGNVFKDLWDIPRGGPINQLLDIIKKKTNLKIKRRLKKMKKETRRRKKRKIFYPRPSCITFSLYKNFINNRYACVPGMYLGSSSSLRGSAAQSSYHFETHRLPEGFPWSGYLTSEHPIRKDKRRFLGISIRRPKDFYRISGLVFTDLKRILMKSNWLRSYLNPYFVKINNIYKQMESSSKKMEIYFKLRDCIKTFTHPRGQSYVSVPASLYKIWRHKNIPPTSVRLGECLYVSTKKEDLKTSHTRGSLRNIISLPEGREILWGEYLSGSLTKRPSRIDRLNFPHLSVGEGEEYRSEQQCFEPSHFLNFVEYNKIIYQRIQRIISSIKENLNLNGEIKNRSKKLRFAKNIRAFIKRDYNISPNQASTRLPVNQTLSLWTKIIKNNLLKFNTYISYGYTPTVLQSDYNLISLTNTPHNISYLSSTRGADVCEGLKCYPDVCQGCEAGKKGDVFEAAIPGEVRGMSSKPWEVFCPSLRLGDVSTKKEVFIPPRKEAEKEVLWRLPTLPLDKRNGSPPEPKTSPALETSNNGYIPEAIPSPYPMGQSSATNLVNGNHLHPEGGVGAHNNNILNISRNNSFWALNKSNAILSNVCGINNIPNSESSLFFEKIVPISLPGGKIFPKKVWNSYKTREINKSNKTKKIFLKFLTTINYGFLTNPSHSFDGYNHILRKIYTSESDLLQAGNDFNDLKNIYGSCGSQGKCYPEGLKTSNTSNTSQGMSVMSLGTSTPEESLQSLPEVCEPPIQNEVANRISRKAGSVPTGNVFMFPQKKRYEHTSHEDRFRYKIKGLLPINIYTQKSEQKLINIENKIKLLGLDFTPRWASSYGDKEYKNVYFRALKQQIRGNLISFGRPLLTDINTSRVTLPLKGKTFKALETLSLRGRVPMSPPPAYRREQKKRGYLGKPSFHLDRIQSLRKATVPRNNSLMFRDVGRHHLLKDIPPQHFYPCQTSTVSMCLLKNGWYQNLKHIPGKTGLCHPTNKTIEVLESIILFKNSLPHVFDRGKLPSSTINYTKIANNQNYWWINSPTGKCLGGSKTAGRFSQGTKHFPWLPHDSRNLIKSTIGMSAHPKGLPKSPIYGKEKSFNLGPIPALIGYNALQTYGLPLPNTLDIFPGKCLKCLSLPGNTSPLWYRPIPINTSTPHNITPGGEVLPGFLSGGDFISLHFILPTGSGVKNVYEKLYPLFSFLFHFCTLISFISLGGVRTLMKFYFILISKMSKLISQSHHLPGFGFFNKISCFVEDMTSAGRPPVDGMSPKYIPGKCLMRYPWDAFYNIANFTTSKIKKGLSWKTSTPLVYLGSRINIPQGISVMCPGPSEGHKSYKKGRVDKFDPGGVARDSWNIQHFPGAMSVNQGAREVFPKRGMPGEVRLKNFKHFPGNVSGKPSKPSPDGSYRGRDVFEAHRLPEGFPLNILDKSNISPGKTVNLMGKVGHSPDKRLSAKLFFLQCVISRNVKFNMNSAKREFYIYGNPPHINTSYGVKCNPVCQGGGVNVCGLGASKYLNSANMSQLLLSSIVSSYYLILLLSNGFYICNKASFSFYLFLLKSVDIFAIPISFIYKFFEKPGEYIVENIAYNFLVEWSADLITTIPDTVDINSYLYFSKINRNIYPFMLSSGVSSFHTIGGYAYPQGWDRVLLNGTSVDNFEGGCIQTLPHGDEGMSPGLPPTDIPGGSSAHISFVSRRESPQNTLQTFPGTNSSLFFLARQTFLLALNSSILKRLFNSMFLIFIQQLCEPDFDYINREKKGMILWDIWGEYLKKIAEENSINIYELTTDKEEQIKLLSKFKFVHTPPVYPISSPKYIPGNVFGWHVLFYGLTDFKHFPPIFEDFPLACPVPNTPSESLPGRLSRECIEEPAGSSGKAFKAFPQTLPEVMSSTKQEEAGMCPLKSYDVGETYPNRRSPQNRKALNLLGGKVALSSTAHELKTLNTFFTSPLWYRKACPIPINTYKIWIHLQGYGECLYVSTIKDSGTHWERGGNVFDVFETEAVSQYLSYQGKDTDLFIDLHPPKSFWSIPSFKYSFSIQQPIGSIVCQIFSGIFYKKISKNILVIGSSGFEKSLLINAIAGETELKIITDNANRYAMVFRGVAVGIKLLRDVFEALSVYTPCIFLLQDIHAIGERRPLLMDENSSSEGDQASGILGASYNKNKYMQGLLLKEKSSSMSREILYKNSKHLLSHYKKPYKELRHLATNHFSFTFLFNNIPPAGADPLIFSKGLKNRKKDLSSLSIQVASSQKENEKKESTSPKTSLWLSTGTEGNVAYEGGKSYNTVPTQTSNKSYASRRMSGGMSPTQSLGGKRMSSTLPNLNTKDRGSHKNLVKEMPWFGIPGEQLSLVSKSNYSIRVKVALLADLVLSNLSVKLDMITDLLVIIDSVKGNKGFVVFGTTHIPSILDPALRRPGRFDETISLPLISSLFTRWSNYRYNVRDLSTCLPAGNVSKTGTVFVKKYGIPFFPADVSQQVMTPLKSPPGMFSIFFGSGYLTKRCSAVFEVCSPPGKCLKFLSLPGHQTHPRDSPFGLRNKTVSTRPNTLPGMYLGGKAASAPTLRGVEVFKHFKHFPPVPHLQRGTTSPLSPKFVKPSPLGKHRRRLPHEPKVWKIEKRPPFRGGEILYVSPKYNPPGLCYPQGMSSGCLKSVTVPLHYKTVSRRLNTFPECIEGEIKIKNKLLLQLKSQNYSFACKYLMSLLLFATGKTVVSPTAFRNGQGKLTRLPISLKWISMLKDLNLASEEPYSVYLNIFGPSLQSYKISPSGEVSGRTDSFILKIILMSLLGGKIGENIASPNTFPGPSLLGDIPMSSTGTGFRDVFLRSKIKKRACRRRLPHKILPNTFPGMYLLSPKAVNIMGMYPPPLPLRKSGSRKKGVGKHSKPSPLGETGVPLYLDVSKSYKLPVGIWKPEVAWKHALSLLFHYLQKRQLSLSALYSPRFMARVSPENLPAPAGSAGKAFKAFPQRGPLGKAFPQTFPEVWKQGMSVNLRKFTGNIIPPKHFPGNLLGGWLNGGEVLPGRLKHFKHFPGGVFNVSGKAAGSYRDRLQILPGDVFDVSSTPSPEGLNTSQGGEIRGSVLSLRDKKKSVGSHKDRPLPRTYKSLRDRESFQKSPNIYRNNNITHQVSNIVTDKLLKFNNKQSLMEAPNPPISTIFLPSKRYENYKKTFNNQYEMASNTNHNTFSGSTIEKLQFHKQQRLLRRLYQFPIKEFLKYEILYKYLDSDRPHELCPQEERHFMGGTQPFGRLSPTRRHETKTSQTSPGKFLKCLSLPRRNLIKSVSLISHEVCKSPQIQSRNVFLLRHPLTVGLHKKREIKGKALKAFPLGETLPTPPDRHKHLKPFPGTLWYRPIPINTSNTSPRQGVASNTSLWLSAGTQGGLTGFREGCEGFLPLRDCIWGGTGRPGRKRGNISYQTLPEGTIDGKATLKHALDNDPNLTKSHNVRLSSINWCYKNLLYNRHKTYLTNQWWNGQQGEHNAETTFLSDIDWRYTLLQNKALPGGVGDINIDFPDAEQFYNPRNRRWLPGSLANGDWNYGSGYLKKKSFVLVREPYQPLRAISSTEDHKSCLGNVSNVFGKEVGEAPSGRESSSVTKENPYELPLTVGRDDIYYHYIYDCFTKAYKFLNKNREIIDFYVERLNQTPIKSEGISFFAVSPTRSSKTKDLVNENEILSLYKRFSPL